MVTRRRQLLGMRIAEQQRASGPDKQVFYQRLLAAGKPKKLALTACARKLLTILNAMARSGKPFDAAIHLG